MIRDAKCSYYCSTFVRNSREKIFGKILNTFLKSFTEKNFEKIFFFICNPVCLRLNYIEILLFNNLSNAE